MPLSTIKFSNISDNTKNLIDQNDLKLYSHNGNLYWNDKEIDFFKIKDNIIFIIFNKIFNSNICIKRYQR